MESYSVQAVLSANVRGFVNGIKQARSQLNDFVSHNTKVFDSFKKIGAGATAGGVAIAAGLGGAVKIAADFESGMSKVAAVSGATGRDLEALSAKAREMGSSTKFSATEAASGLEYMALAGWNTEQMMAGIEPTLNLAAAAGMDLAQTSDIVTDAMSMFQMEADEAARMADTLAASSSKTNTDVGQLGEALKYAGANANAANMDIEKTSAFLGLLADNGLKGSIAGTTLNAILRDLKNNADDGAVAVGDQTVALYDSEGQMRDMTHVMDDLIKATSHLSDEQRDQAISAVFGQEALKGFNIYAAEGVGAIGKLEGELRNSKDAAKDMAEIMMDNLNGALENLSSAFQEAAIAIGLSLVPHIRKLAEFLMSLVNKFNALDERAKTIIAIVAALSAGFLLLVGPILMLIGFLPSIIAGIKMLGIAIGALTGPIGLAVAAIAAIGIGVGLLVRKLRKDAIPEVERFGEGVSESTQEAVGSFMDMSDKADVALKELAWSQEAVTQKMATDMREKQGEITKVLLSAIDDRRKQELEQTQNQIAQLENISEDQKRRMIEQTNERFDAEAQAVENGNARINGIIQTAADKGRKITQEESDQILAIRESMTSQAVRVMSDGELEQKIIYEKMKDNAEKVSAQEAAEVVRSSIEKKEGVIKEANDQFDETYKWALRQRDELNTISAEEADEIIEEAKRKRNETVKSAEDMHNLIVEQAKSMSGEFVDLINWMTGEVMSDWEVMRNKTVTKMKEIGESISDGFSKASEMAVNKVTETKDAIVAKYEEIKDSIKSKLTEATAILDEKITGMTQSIRDSVDRFKQAGRDIIQGLIDGISSKFDSVRKIISNLADSIPEWVKKILGIASPSKVFKKIGEDTTEGLEIGLLARKKKVEQAMEDIGKAMKAVAVKDAKGKAREMSAIQKDRLDALKTYIDDKKSLEEISIIEEARIWELSLSNFREGTKERVEAQKQYKSAVEAVHKEVESINETHLNRMKQINDEYDQESTRMMEEYERQFESRVNSILSFAGLFDDFVSEVDKTGKDLLNNLQSQVDGLKEWRDTLESLMTRIDDDALMRELEAMGPKALGDLKALNKMSDRELKKFISLYQERSKLAVEQATDELAELKDNTELRIEEMRRAADEELDVLHKDWINSIAKLTKTTDDELRDLRRIGRDAGQGLNAGLESMRGELISTARSIANSVKSAMERALDIHSPSRWMRDHIGKNMMLGWMEGIEAMKSSVLRLTDQATGWMTPAVGLDIPSFNDSRRSYGGVNNTPPSNKQGGGDIIQNITINSPKPLSPSETARLNKQAARQLTQEWWLN